MLSNASISLSALTPSGTLVRNDSRGTFRPKGRDKPVNINGTIAGRTYRVEMVLTSDADYSTLLSIFEARSVVCYRDHKGNLIFGKIARLPDREDIARRECTFEVIEVEYDEEV